MIATEAPAPRAAALVLLTVVLASAVCYSPALVGGFVYDDAHAVLNNPAAVGLTAALRSFLDPFWAHRVGAAPYWRPLATISFALDRTLFGLRPAAFHAVNLALHATASALVAAYALRIAAAAAPSAPIVLACAAGAGLLAASHPIHSETVAAIYCRPDLLAAVFSLAFLNLAASGRRGLALGALALALLSKESAFGVALLAPAALAPINNDEPRWRRAAWMAAPLALAAIYLAGRRAAVGGIPLAPAIDRIENPLAGASPATRWLTPLAIVAETAGLWLFPSSLCVDRGFGAVNLAGTILDPRVILGASIIAAWAVAAAILARRRSPAAWPLACAAAAYLPSSNLLFLAPALTGERFAYLPSLLALAALGSLMASSPAKVVAYRRPSWVRAAALAVVLLLAAAGARTFSRSFEFRDDVALFRGSLRSCPDSAKARFDLGNALAAQGRSAEAIAAYRSAVEAAPWYAPAQSNLGSALLGAGRPEEAVESYRRAIADDPDQVKPRANLASALLRLGRRDEAEAETKAALALGPTPQESAFLKDLAGRLARAPEGGVDRPR